VARLEPLALSAHFCGEEGTSKYPVATTSAIAYASASEVTVPGDDCFECDSYRRLTIKFTCAHCPRRSAVQDSQQSESSAVCGAWTSTASSTMRTALEADRSPRQYRVRHWYGSLPIAILLVVGNIERGNRPRRQSRRLDRSVREEVADLAIWIPA